SEPAGRNRDRVLGACMGLALLEGLIVYLSFVFNQTLSGAANRGSPKLYRSGLFLPTATSCGDSRCFSLSHRPLAPSNHIRTKSPGLPDSRIVPGVVMPATVQLLITPAPFTPVRGGSYS